MYFVGDLHLGHEKVAAIRGFASVDQHDLFIFDQWQRTVRPEDVVYVLGDISSGREQEEEHALRVLGDLPGHKTLITGNHDSVSGVHRKWSAHTPWFRDVFERIQDFGRIRMNNRMVLLSHYPYWSSGDGPTRDNPRYQWPRLADTGHLLIHGHTHHNDPYDGSSTGRELCVSWDARRGFTTEGDVAKWVEETVNPKTEIHVDYDCNICGGIRTFAQDPDGGRVLIKDCRC